MSAWVVAGFTVWRPPKLECDTPKMKVGHSKAYFIVLVAARQTSSSGSWSGKTLVPV